MKNKKGFTLIELLAVLVVLAILALISIPITIRIINNARENSYKRSIAAYGRATEDYIGEYLLKNNVDYKDITYEMIKDNIKSTGHSVECKKLQFSSDGDIVLRGCSTANSKVYKYENRQVKEDAYEVGDEVIINNMKFHVIERSDSSKDYVAAMYDDNLTNSELSSYGAQGKTNGFGHIPMKGYSYNSSLAFTVVNNWSSTLFESNELTEINGYLARLISIDDLDNLGYRIEGTGSDTRIYLTDKVPKWFYASSDRGYWTMTRSRSRAGSYYCVTSSGNIQDCDLNYSAEKIRPVINIDKDKIDS